MEWEGSWFKDNSNWIIPLVFGLMVGGAIGTAYTSIVMIDALPHEVMYLNYVGSTSKLIHVQDSFEARDLCENVLDGNLFVGPLMTCVFEVNK